MFRFRGGTWFRCRCPPEHRQRKHGCYQAIAPKRQGNSNLLRFGLWADRNHSLPHLHRHWPLQRALF